MQKTKPNKRREKPKPKTQNQVCKEDLKKMNLYIILSTVNCDTVFRVYTLGKLKMHRGLLQFKLGLFILVVVLFCLLFYMYQIILRVVNGNCNLAMCSCEYLYNTIKRIIRIMYIYTIIHTKHRVIYIYIYTSISKNVEGEAKSYIISTTYGT